MSTKWLTPLKTSPIPALFSSKSEATEYLPVCDLLNESVEARAVIWGLPEFERLLGQAAARRLMEAHRQKNRSYPKIINQPAPVTWKVLRILVERYELTRQHAKNS